jgi:hypothetical protein
MKNKAVRKAGSWMLCAVVLAGLGYSTAVLMVSIPRLPWNKWLTEHLPQFENSGPGLLQVAVPT